MTNLVANWSYPTAIRFGAGRIAELADACKAAGIAQPLLVTDSGLAKLDITQRALEIMRDGGLSPGIFSNVRPNPVEANLTNGVNVFKAGGHDGVVAFGGGSGLDTGKLIAFMAGQKRPVWDFEDVGDWWTRADADRIAPIVAVPTTAGTGSEVGRAGRRHRRDDAYEEGDLPSEDDAEDRHLRPGTHRRHAALHHRRHRHGCAGALP